MVLLLSGKDCEFFSFQHHDSQMQKKNIPENTQSSRGIENTQKYLLNCVEVVQSD